MKKILTILLVVLLVGVTMITGIYNYYNNDSFLKASVTQILTLIITLGIAFWATQYKTDVRKTKEHAEAVIEKLQQIVTNEQFCVIRSDRNKEEVQKTLTIANRKISNCISVLKEYGKMLKFEKEISYINGQFETYKTTIGDHINDLDYLSKTEPEFRRIAENIDSKCDYIILTLYK